MSWQRRGRSLARCEAMETVPEACSLCGLGWCTSGVEAVRETGRRRQSMCQDSGTVS